MSRRRFLAYVGVVATGLLTLFGIAVFIGGLALELFADRDAAEATLDTASPFVMMALGGLCLAALMFFTWFVLVGLLLARQTRRVGSGYGDAYRLIEAFRFREAIPLLERSISEGKETSDVLLLLTSAYAYSGQLAKATSTAERAVRLFPDDPSAYISLANSYRLQAAYDSAADALKVALERDPHQPVLWAELGFVQRLAADDAAALESFKHAAEHAMPAMYGVRVHYHLARAFQANNQTSEAVNAIARMMSARDGLQVWSSNLDALKGTAYGTALRYEIKAIEQAIADADAGNLG
jgi:tetratricopeptide (TPR) repeat protein